MIYHRDTRSNVYEYEPIASIEFRGTVSATGESSGHYICDVKPKSNENWFRTNDNEHPKSILKKQVTKCNYVTLYKRK